VERGAHQQFKDIIMLPKSGEQDLLQRTRIHKTTSAATKRRVNFLVVKTTSYAATNMTNAGG
jgi:hypothetical protein